MRSWSSEYANWSAASVGPDGLNPDYSSRRDGPEGRRIEVTIDGPATSSNGGWLLARAVDDATGTTAGMPAQLRDPRDPSRRV